MDDTISQLDKQYEENSRGIFPFLSKYRVTVLEEGLYKQNKARHYGVRYLFDRQQRRFKTILAGYLYVSEKIIIVPPTVEMTPGKIKFIQAHADKGYKLVTEFPALYPIEFFEGSEIYLAAKKIYQEFKRQKTQKV